MKDNTLGIWLVNSINSLFITLFLYPFLTSCEELYTEFVVLLTTLLIFKIGYKNVRYIRIVESGCYRKWPYSKMSCDQNDHYPRPKCQNMWLKKICVLSLNIITKSIGFRFFNRWVRCTILSVLGRVSWLISHRNVVFTRDHRTSLNRYWPTVNCPLNPLTWIYFWN